MRRILSYLPFLASALVFAILFEVTAHPNILPYAVAGLGAVVILTSGVLCFQALLRRSAIAPGAMPALLIGGTTFAYFFLEDATIRFVVSLAVSVLFLVLVRHLAESTKLPGSATELRALSEWSALIALVGLTAGLLGSITFLNTNRWFGTLVFAMVSFYVSFVLARLSGVRGFLVPTAVSILLVQGFIVIEMLPTSHWVGSGVLGAIAYLLFSILTSVQAVKMRRVYFSVGIICLVLLGTARWQ